MMKSKIANLLTYCFGDLFSIRHGYGFKGEYFTNSGSYILLTPGNFYDEGGFKHKGDKEKYYVGEIPEGFVLQEGDLIVAMTEQMDGLLGSSAIVPASNKYLHNQRLGLIVDIKDNLLDKKFLYYLFNTSVVRNQIKASASGTKVKHTSPSRIYEVKVNIPPVSAQRKIADVLSAYDDLIAVNTRRIRILEQMAQSVYREWFGKVNGRSLPEGWKVGRLDDALVLQRGFDLPKQDRREGDVPIYASTGITGTHIEAKVKGPGVVTGRSGSLGTVIYIEEDFWPLNTTLWVKEFRRVTPLYAYYLLKELGFSQFNSGVAVPTLNRNDVHSLPVIIPSKEILSKFDDFVLPLYGLRRALTLKNANLRRTRDLLLPRLVSGEVMVP